VVVVAVPVSAALLVAAFVSTLVVVVVVVAPAVDTVSAGGLQATIIPKQAVTANKFLKIIIKSLLLKGTCKPVPACGLRN
jgi:hypothetical protein